MEWEARRGVTADTGFGPELLGQSCPGQLRQGGLGQSKVGGGGHRGNGRETSKFIVVAVA